MTTMSNYLRGLSVDLIVTPESRIARLPKAARLPALLVRNVVDLAKTTSNGLLRRSYGFVYVSYGMATAHHSPFLNDRRFNNAYGEMASWWWHGRYRDVRWTMWFLSQCAAQCKALSGSFIEFGVGRAGCAFMILSMAELETDQRFYLFDTFSGIPESSLMESERDLELAGRHANTSVEHVKQVLRKWSSNIVLVIGDVFETLPEIETGPIAFCHLDLNASAPTKLALEYLYPRLIPS